MPKHLFLSTLMTFFLLCFHLIIPTVLISQEAPNKNMIRLRLPLWILNRSIPIDPKFDENALSLLFDSKKINVTKQAKPGNPTLIFLALDLVGNPTISKTTKLALSYQIQQMPSDYWVCLISAQENITVIQPPTNNKQLLQNKLDSTNQIGKAGLLESFQALMDLSSSVLNQSNIRVIVLLVTDSDAKNYRDDYENPTINESDGQDLSRRFVGRKLQEDIGRLSEIILTFIAPLVLVHVDPEDDDLNLIYQRGLLQLTKTVGGHILASKSVGDIPDTFEEAFDWINKSFVIDFMVPKEEKRGPFPIKIELDSSVNSSVNLNYPKRLLLPGEIKK